MEITFIELLILSLACFRLTRLIVFDRITEPFRILFLDEKLDVEDISNPEIYYVPTEKSGFMNFTGQLITCHWCTGIWVAFFIMWLHFFVPYSMYFIIMLALAGLASIIEVVVQKFMYDN